MKLLLALVVAIGSSFAPSVSNAGGGPENLLLIVNSNSESSKTIANHYIRLRKIPAENVLYLDWKGHLGYSGAIAFREKILVPILLALDARHLTQQIDYFVYSSDFPWKIELQEMTPGYTYPKGLGPQASITGATYLMPHVLAASPSIVNPDGNWYVPGPTRPNIEQCHELANVPSRGFRSRYTWDKDGKKTAASPESQRYCLSMMLGITQPRGNTVDEVLNYLRRSTMADGTHPKGTIYFMWNKDVRSAARDKCFSSVAAQINAAGVRAVVKQGRLPTGAKDVAGLMVGAADFNLAKDGVNILPGAICEHLTSEGAIFVAGGSNQSPLSDFLRAGAAGASGTVVEPLALQAKFPLASVQLHYVRGCSLAESFYQSIACPYQILIVGDPLCQPWASIPTIAVGGVKKDEKVKGTISLTPSALGALSYEFYVDGRLRGQVASAAPLTLDTTKLSDGYHELRIVGIRSDSIETQGRAIIPIIVNNHDAAVELVVTPSTRVPLSAKLKVKVRQPGATSIAVRQNSRDVGNVKGESGELEIPATSLGRGPTTLQAISQGKAAAASVPVQVFVD